MKFSWAAGVAGLLFGAGLMLSGLADPVRVLAFLTLGPAWDPSLLAVMGAAVAVAAPGIALTNRRGKSLLGTSLPAAPSRIIDRRLVGGAALFGIGWGLAGFCPGPALVAAGQGFWTAWIFLPAMLLGAWLVLRVQRTGP